MFCAQCGKQLHDSTRYCNYCGAPQSGQPAQSPHPNTNQSNNQWPSDSTNLPDQPSQGVQYNPNQQWQSSTPVSGYQPLKANPTTNFPQNQLHNPSFIPKQQWNPDLSAPSNSVQGLIGFSPKIQDPAFAKYSKASSKYSMIFGTILALIAIIGFPIYGSSSGEVDFPESLYYGLIIGGMFFLIAVVQTLRKGSDTTWDGLVIDKKTARRTYTDNNDNNSTVHHYIEYKFVVQRENGKKYKHTFRDQPGLYNYYEQGGRVRHHKGMTYYEKYDKSRDNEILCAACLTMNDIHENQCSRCKCPLLKG